jgi:hypothetical protein
MARQGHEGTRRIRVKDLVIGVSLGDCSSILPVGHDGRWLALGLLGGRGSGGLAPLDRGGGGDGEWSTFVDGGWVLAHQLCKGRGKLFLQILGFRWCRVMVSVKGGGGGGIRSVA